MANWPKMILYYGPYQFFGVLLKHCWRETVLKMQFVCFQILRHESKNADMGFHLNFVILIEASQNLDTWLRTTSTSWGRIPH